MIDVTKLENEALGMYVAMYNKLKLNRELASACMRELVKRREEGSEFDYETFITDKVNNVELPKPQLTNNKSSTMMDLRSVLNKFVGKK